MPERMPHSGMAFPYTITRHDKPATEFDYQLWTYRQSVQAMNSEDSVSYANREWETQTFLEHPPVGFRA